MNKTQYLAKTLSLSESQVDKVLLLLSEGATIPFIARYRKEETGNLSDVTLRAFEEENEKIDKLLERKETVLKTIEEQGKLTSSLKEQIDNCVSLNELEALYRPYRPKRKTRGSIAKEKGLEPLTLYLKKQKGSISELEKYAESFVDEKKKVLSTEEAIGGALDILSEEVADNPDYYLEGKNYLVRTGKIATKRTKEDMEGKYANYDSFEANIKYLKPHQILAILRGKREKKLSYSFSYDKQTTINAIARNYIQRHSPFEELLRKMIEDSYKRLLEPSLENEIINDLFEKAQESSLKLFAKNLKELLLASPLKGKQILGFDPGYRNGCKLALIDKEGKVLETGIIYPTIGKEKESVAYLKNLYHQYGFNAIALGNGTASRESEAFLQRFLENEGLKDKVLLVIVNESGASVYSASPLAIKEFPKMDIDERSAVSLARRLLDPMAELVKIPPEAIGVGQYQHDMDEKKLKETLEAATTDAVNEVGVWLNTASFSLLRYVSGISSKLAEEIVHYRDENGTFKERKDLLKVKGFGQKTFMDAAGFLRIENANPLERSAVHPKDYQATMTLLNVLGLSLKDLGTDKAKLLLEKDLSFEELQKKTGLGPYTLKDIIEELKKPGRDLRESIETASLENSVKDIKDLKEGMILNGTVRNLSDFGAFVDIGVHQDGLVYIKEIANHYISNPSECLKLGQIVKVKVIGVDLARKRISLSIKQVD